MAGQYSRSVDPSTIPVATPPIGIMSILKDPPTLEAATMAIGVIMIPLTFAAVGARLYATIRVTHTTGLEDCELDAPMNFDVRPKADMQRYLRDCFGKFAFKRLKSFSSTQSVF